MTTAVFGGSFNPPHIGHQLACLTVLETYGCDRVLVVPVYRHPFDKQLLPFADRFAMCEEMAAFAPGRVEVSRIEEELGGDSSRTLTTLQALIEKSPDEPLRLVIGADILGEVGKWHRWSEIERLAPPIVLGRLGHPAVQGAEIALPEVSSTEIRTRLAAGADVSKLVPTRVLHYIRSRNLYHPAL